MKNIKIINRRTSEDRLEFYKTYFRLTDKQKYNKEHKPEIMIYVCDFIDNGTDENGDEILYTNSSYMLCSAIWQESDDSEYYKEHWRADIDNVELETYNVYEALAYWHIKTLELGGNFTQLKRLYQKGMLKPKPNK
jgi:hypothetical protein